MRYSQLWSSNLGILGDSFVFVYLGTPNAIEDPSTLLSWVIGFCMRLGRAMEGRATMRDEPNDWIRCQTKSG